jgi:hypothetical protein
LGIDCCFSFDDDHRLSTFLVEEDLLDSCRSLLLLIGWCDLALSLHRFRVEQRPNSLIRSERKFPIVSCEGDDDEDLLGSCPSALALLFVWCDLALSLQRFTVEDPKSLIITERKSATVCGEDDDGEEEDIVVVLVDVLWVY